MRGFQAVIFDLDGVLTDTASFHYQAWRTLAAGLGIELDLAMNEQLKGISRMESLERILALGQQQYSDAEKQHLAEQKNRHYRELIQAMSPHDILPGANALLEQLQAHGIPLALASASRNAPDILRQLDLHAYFQFVADPAAVARGKPYPDIFLAAAHGLAVAPQHCLAFEDAPAGITAIKAAGMYAVGIGSPTVLTEADQVFTSLAEFPLQDYHWQAR